MFFFFAEQALSLKIKRRGQSFADKKCYKSVQINFSGEIQTFKRFTEIFQETSVISKFFNKRPPYVRKFLFNL